jgi:hypothetical protein
MLILSDRIDPGLQYIPFFKQDGETAGLSKLGKQLLPLRRAARDISESRTGV